MGSSRRYNSAIILIDLWKIERMEGGVRPFDEEIAMNDNFGHSFKPEEYGTTSSYISIVIVGIDDNQRNTIVHRATTGTKYNFMCDDDIVTILNNHNTKVIIADGQRRDWVLKQHARKKMAREGTPFSERGEMRLPVRLWWLKSGNPIVRADVSAISIRENHHSNVNIPLNERDWMYAFEMLIEHMAIRDPSLIGDSRERDIVQTIRNPDERVTKEQLAVLLDLFGINLRSNTHKVRNRHYCELYCIVRDCGTISIGEVMHLAENIPIPYLVTKALWAGMTDRITMGQKLVFFERMVLLHGRIMSPTQLEQGAHAINWWIETIADQFFPGNDRNMEWFLHLGYRVSRAGKKMKAVGDYVEEWLETLKPAFFEEGARNRRDRTGQRCSTPR